MKIITLLIAVMSFQIYSLQAQTSVNPWQITLGANAVEFYEKNGTQYQIGNDGLQFDDKVNFSKYLSYLEISRYLSKGITFHIGGTLNQVGRITSNLSENPDLYYSIDGSFSLSSTAFLNTGNLNPTIILGVGHTNINELSHMTANMGVGLTYMFDQSFGLTLKAKRKVFSPDVTKLFDKSVTDGDYVNQFLFGFTYAFGNGDSDRDGVKDDVDACVNTPGLPELNGCPDDDGDGVRNNEDNCPDVAGTATNAGCPEYPIEGLEELSVQFESDSFEIDAAFEEQLAEAFRIIDANSNATIIIEGHADSTGNDQINIPLSELRASQVLDYLIKAGISTERLSIVGYGSSQPLGDNSTSEGRAQNRRVDFTVE